MQPYNFINNVAESQKVAYAFLELRCSFGTCSIVSDVAVFEWSRIPFDADREPMDDVFIAPDWTIEILSPEQSSDRVIGNILYCIQHGCRLGWLLAPDDQSLLTFLPQKQPELCRGADHLPLLTGIDLELTTDQIFIGSEW